MPAIAIITVRPEMSTERPEVAAAASSAASLAAAGGPFLPLALEVEHRVVDADREPDQEHDRAGASIAIGTQVARQRDQPEGREDGRQREQQRDAGGDERAEGDQRG